MISLSFCSIAFRNEPLETIVPRLAAIGYDAVEVWANHVHEKSDEELRALKDLAAAHGIALLVISPYFWLTQSEDLLQESLQIAERVVHCAQVMGIPKVRTFTDAGPTGIGSDVGTEAHWQTAVSALQRITAMDPNLRFVVETHEKTLADTPASTLQLLERVGAPNLKVLYQGNAPTMIEHYEILKPHIEHMHLQNTGTDGGPGWVDEGEIDVPAFLARLQEDGYAESLSVEYCWKGVTWERAESAYAYLTPRLSRLQ